MVRRLALCVLIPAGCAPSSRSDDNNTAADGGTDFLPSEDVTVETSDDDGAFVPPDDYVWPTHTSNGSSWTVLVYMLADNNLENFALADLAEMMKVGSNDGFTLLVQADRSSSYSDAGIGGLDDWTSTKRLGVGVGKLTEIDDLGETNMVDVGTLANFIAWGVQNYPADRYALVLWDHGSSWAGFGRDESESKTDLLTLVELSQALHAGMQAAPLGQFALIGYDACLMSNYEVAVTMRPFAEYLLASQELEPGHGWDYTALAQTLADPTRAPAQLGQDLLDGYKAQAEAKGTNLEITLSLTDLTLLGAVETAMTTLTGQMKDNMGASIVDVARERGLAQAFGTSPKITQDRHLLDLLELAQRFSKLGGDAAAPAVALESALDDALVARVNGPGRLRAHGLSIYFPPSSQYYTADYKEIAGIGPWRSMLETFFDPEAAGIDDAPSVPTQLFEYDGMNAWLSPAANEYEGFGYAELNTSSLISAVDFRIGEYNPAANSLVLFETSEGWIVEHPEWDPPFSVVKGNWSGDAWYATDWGDKKTLVHITTEAQPVDGVPIEPGNLTGNWLWVLSVPFRYARAGHSACDPDNEEWEPVVLRFGNDQMALITLMPILYTETTAEGLSELVPEAGSTLCPELLHVVDAGTAEESWEWQPSNVEFNATDMISVTFEERDIKTNVGMAMTAWDFAGNSETVYLLGPPEGLGSEL